MPWLTEADGKLSFLRADKGYTQDQRNSGRSTGEAQSLKPTERPVRVRRNRSHAKGGLWLTTAPESARARSRWREDNLRCARAAPIDWLIKPWSSSHMARFEW
jgi:hypothetical protein